jgi:hypothetical protein
MLDNRPVPYELYIDVPFHKVPSQPSLSEPRWNLNPMVDTFSTLWTTGFLACAIRLIETDDKAVSERDSVWGRRTVPVCDGAKVGKCMHVPL